MVKKLSEDLKWRIIYCYEEGFKPKEIAECVDDLENITSRDMQIDYYLDELIYEMELKTGKLVSIPTLWHSLQYCGFAR
ncbi:hypothetical protein RhiirA4_480078 [Rhizophagus irregularis]|uniref:Uncharacterized protein n=1 Tax=Rhizophagus irregularis TaxID=588596 RepID=A0A2I1HHC7_9GLOM|nr:hypothetical protein RhiirA4_480078 [Rhizophagus irregularis]